MSVPAPRFMWSGWQRIYQLADVDWILVFP